MIKNTDAREFLTDAERAILQLLGDTIARCRRMTGRREFESVVVESDWPEYEPTWKAIEARMSSPNIVHEPRAGESPSVPSAE